jgi:hypothetical protein
MNSIQDRLNQILSATVKTASAFDGGSLAQGLGKFAASVTPERNAYLQKVAFSGMEFGKEAALFDAEKLAEELKQEQGAAAPMNMETGAASISPETQAVPNVNPPNALFTPVNVISPENAIQSAVQSTGTADVPALSSAESEYVKQKAQALIAQVGGGIVPTDQVQ